MAQYAQSEAMLIKTRDLQAIVHSVVFDVLAGLPTLTRGIKYNYNN